MQQHGAWQAAEINVVRTINERLYNLTAQTAKKRNNLNYFTIQHPAACTRQPSDTGKVGQQQKVELSEFKR